MGFFADLVSHRYATREEYAQGWLGGIDELGTPSSSGTRVTAESALGLTTVYSCVRIIAWTIASLPLITYRETPSGGKTRAKENALYRMLHDRPNPQQTSFQWRSLMSVHQNLWGAGISEIEFNGSGVPVALWPIPPWRVAPKRSQSAEVYYMVSLENGGERRLESYQVVVFPAMSTSSFGWMSPIAVHRETIGRAMDVNAFGGRTFSQGTNPAGIIEHPNKLRAEAAESLKEDFKQYQGLSNSHRLMLLEDGMKFQRVGLPPEDAQYLETRRFDISEIARIYNVPPHLLQDHEKATTWGSGLEELNSGFVTFTLRPYLVQWEQELAFRLFDGPPFFVEFLVEGLLRGKLKDRYEAYAKGRINGWLSANEVRGLENLNALDGPEGDMYLVPMNLQDASKVGDEPEPNPGEDPPIDEETDPEDDDDPTEGGPDVDA